MHMWDRWGEVTSHSMFHPLGLLTSVFIFHSAKLWALWWRGQSQPARWGSHLPQWVALFFFQEMSPPVRRNGAFQEAHSLSSTPAKQWIFSPGPDGSPGKSKPWGDFLCGGSYVLSPISSVTTSQVCPQMLTTGIRTMNIPGALTTCRAWSPALSLSFHQPP